MSGDDDDNKSEVFTEDNNIFFFCEVSTKTVRELCVNLQKLSAEYDDIRVNIRSDGGCVYAGCVRL